VPEGRVNLKIDAGAAFGTGHHGTTVGCLEAFDTLLKTETFDKVLDVGCGTGVLAIAAAKTGSPIAVGTDIDEPSARIANENAENNDAKCDFFFADGLRDPRPTCVAKPPGPPCERATAPGGIRPPGRG